MKMRPVMPMARSQSDNIAPVIAPIRFSKTIMTPEQISAEMTIQDTKNPISPFKRGNS